VFHRECENETPETLLKRLFWDIWDFKQQGGIRRGTSIYRSGNLAAKGFEGSSRIFKV
jgi:hypothetical protein